MPTARPSRLQSFKYFDAVDAHPEVDLELVEFASDVLEGFNRTARQEDRTLGEMWGAALEGLEKFVEPCRDRDAKLRNRSGMGLAMVIAADGLAAACQGIESFGPTGARR